MQTYVADQACLHPRWIYARKGEALGCKVSGPSTKGPRACRQRQAADGYGWYTAVLIQACGTGGGQHRLLQVMQARAGSVSCVFMTSAKSRTKSTTPAADCCAPQGDAQRGLQLVSAHISEDPLLHTVLAAIPCSVATPSISKVAIDWGSGLVRLGRRSTT